jgi:hypothetical protein
MVAIGDKPDMTRTSRDGRQKRPYSVSGQLTPTDNQQPKPIEKRSSRGKKMPLIDVLKMGVSPTHSLTDNLLRGCIST